MSQLSIHPLWGSLALDRGGGLSLQDQIVQFFRSAILSGTLSKGRKVPSSRRIATEHGISRTTAVEAYARLAAEGYLTPRPGSGLFVCDALPEAYLTRAARPSPALPALAEAYVPAGNEPGLPSRDTAALAPWIPALDHFPWKDWARFTAQINRERPIAALCYGNPRGEQVFREVIAEYLAVARGVSCTADQIIVTGSSKHGIEMALRAVGVAGDQVWMEEPGHHIDRDIIKGAGLVAVPVGVDQGGIDVAEGLRLAPEARLALVTPAHQFPFGYTLSLDRRLAMLDWAERTGAYLVENDHDGEYRYAGRPLPPLHTLDRSGRVIYIGSLSNILAPGLRIGYLVAPPDLVDAFLVMRASLTPIPMQLVLARFIASGRLSSHLRRMRILYAQRRLTLIAALKEEASDLFDIVVAPDAGTHLVVQLHRPIDDVAAAKRCLEKGIFVHPLSNCYANTQNRRFGFMLGFASTPDEKIRPAVRTLAEVIRAS
ncbi:MAG: PLP-dependent aminotransferase family protein [Caulobacteraceae bacterium]